MEIDEYHSGRSAEWGDGQEVGNGYCIDEFCNRNEEHVVAQGESSGEEEVDSVTEDERDTRLEEGEREKWSAVVHTQTPYSIEEGRRNKLNKVPRGNYQLVPIVEDVPLVSLSGSNQREQTIRNAVAFSE